MLFTCIYSILVRIAPVIALGLYLLKHYSQGYLLPRFPQWEFRFRMRDITVIRALITYFMWMNLVVLSSHPEKWSGCVFSLAVILSNAVRRAIKSNIVIRTYEVYSYCSCLSNNSFLVGSPS